MRPVRWHAISLRRTLTLVLSAGIGVLMAVELVLASRTAVEAADAAYDRSLLGAIKSIDANISTASGGLGVEVQFRMLEFFQLTADGRVYYRVATEDGLVEIGDPALPAPGLPLATGRPHFENARYFGQPVRLGSYARLLDRPIAGQPAPQRVVIQVAETTGSREAFAGRLVRQAVGRDLALLALSLALLFAGVTWSLRPLARLRAEVASRSPDDLAPIATGEVPADVRPLVDAINHHVERSRTSMEARRRFLDDASHQLRTPLATLATQVGFALRESDPGRLRDALTAVKSQLDEAIRQANQLLALGRADSAELVTAPLDLVAFAGELVRSGWPQARDRQIDLGLEAPDAPVPVLASEPLLKEALSNLLHNALRFTPAGGRVTVRVAPAGGQARLAVIDDGPGIPAAELPKVGERFFRASNARVPGSGLGLAIARAVAQRHGGRLEVAAGASGAGLVAAIVLPLQGPAAADPRRAG